MIPRPNDRRSSHELSMQIFYMLAPRFFIHSVIGGSDSFCPKIEYSSCQVLIVPLLIFCLVLVFMQRQSGESINATVAIFATYSYAFDVVAVAIVNMASRRSESLVDQSNIITSTTYVGPPDIANPSTGT